MFMCCKVEQQLASVQVSVEARLSEESHHALHRPLLSFRSEGREDICVQSRNVRVR